MTRPSQVLVVVHPGSACGSADFNIGRRAAGEARMAMAALMDAWTGGIVVLDGDLSDELPNYPEVSDAITRLVRRSRRSGMVSLRAMASDPDHFDAIQSIAREHHLGEYDIVITGAWFDPDNQEGCVNSVVDALAEIGIDAHVAEGAVVSVGRVNDVDQPTTAQVKNRSYGASP